MNMGNLPVPAQIASGKQAPLNVREAWPIYDTMILSPQFYGPESQNRGWFTSFPTFAAAPYHSFFMNRTESTASLAYCNKQSADSMDFAYYADSIGVAFFAPSARILNPAPTGPSALNYVNTQIAHWWETVLPTHCSLEFKVQQDTILEIPCLAAPPGYGPTNAGASFEHENPGRIDPDGAGQPDYMPVMNMGVTQGVPYIKSRWKFASGAIQIPRTGTIEALVRVSEIAQYELSQTNFSPHYTLGGSNATGNGEYNTFPARFGIQVSLLGERRVQQRGNYHA